MSRINISTFGGNLSGEFVVEAKLKIFGPNGRVENPENERSIALHLQGRQYSGRLAQRRLFEPRGGVLQIVWSVSYDIGSILTSYRGNGYGSILQSWRIPPAPARIQFQPYRPPAHGGGATYRLDQTYRIVEPPQPRPALTYLERPRQSLAQDNHTNLDVEADVSQQDVPISGNCGEITARLNISFRKFEVETEGRSTNLGNENVSYGTERSTETVNSQGGGFACCVVVPYSG